MLVYLLPLKISLRGLLLLAKKLPQRTKLLILPLYIPELMLGHLLPLQLLQGELLSLPLRTTTTTKETTATSKNIARTANDAQVTLRLPVTNPQCHD